MMIMFAAVCLEAGLALGVSPLKVMITFTLILIPGHAKAARGLDFADICDNELAGARIERKVSLEACPFRVAGQDRISLAI
jgi:hypothetical protein